MRNKRRVEAIVHATMMTSTQFWKQEYARMQHERDLWKSCADQFAVAEAPHEHVMAFEAWEELTTKHLAEVESK